jgi:hypothetical protein
MKKVLKVGGSLLVGALVLALITLRLTGLEPQSNLEGDQLRARGGFPRPGLWLPGEVVTTTVNDWSFVNTLEHPGRLVNNIMVETRTPYFIPHSVTMNVLSHNGRLYVHSQQPKGAMHLEWPYKFWTRNVARDPRVRMKIGGKLYEMTLVMLTDRAEAAEALGKDPETREKGPDGKELAIGYMHVYRAFQRNVPDSFQRADHQLSSVR